MRATRRFFNDYEKMIVHKYYPTTTATLIGEHLGRNPLSIRQYARLNNIRKVVGFSWQKADTVIND